jgi:DNA-binding LacI/PurR family transcriptional regulator
MSEAEYKKKITISDVADALGVSKTTVSRAISGKGRIGTDTRLKVLNYITEHHYKPNFIARGLAQSKTFNIALVLPGDYYLTELPFFQNCMLGISQAAGKKDYDVIISMVTPNDNSQLERVINNHKVDGVILSRTLVQDAPLELLKQKNVPYVAIGSTEDRTVVQIDNDHVGACKELTSLLLMQGIRKTALLGGNRNHIVTQKRFQGYQEAFHEMNLSMDEATVYFDVEETYVIEKIVEDLLDQRIECVFCMDDYICMHVISCLRRKNVKIPQDIKVASFYNSQMLKNNIPGITSLQFNNCELGMAACNTLLNMLNGEMVTQRTLLGYDVILKESTQMKH